jgi:hypothetical protein|uniref:Uncharacterized protein n=1 Tax=Ignisphaera aggregans TaxID=334771 RepID=A0A7J2U253_9CREN
MIWGSGKLVKNPQLIMRYVEELKKKGLNASIVVPSHGELELVEKAAKERTDMLKVMEELINYFKNRIDKELAKNIIKEVLGEEVDDDTASYIMSRELAAWVLEIAEILNIIKISNALY